MLYCVQLGDLDDTISRVVAFEAQLKELIDSVQARINRMHASWQGSAADDQRERHAAWQAQAAAMHAALSKLRAIAQGAHANYSASQTSLAARWSGLQ